MSYIDRNLLAGEQIKFRTKKHPILFAFPLAWTIFSVYASQYMLKNLILHQLAWVPWFVALLFWAQRGFEYLSSEFAVTNKRVMMREGFLYRHTNEVRLTAISQVNVEQSILGQIMNYGVVSINAFGAFDAYTLIARPFQFQQHVNAEVDKAVKG